MTRDSLYERIYAGLMIQLSEVRNSVEHHKVIGTDRTFLACTEEYLDTCARAHVLAQAASMVVTECMECGSAFTYRSDDNLPECRGCQAEARAISAEHLLAEAKLART